MLPCRFFSTKVIAGFSSPVDGHIEKRLNIHEYLVDHYNSTFIVTIAGESMRDAELLLKEIAIVDRSKGTAVGNIILAVVGGEFAIKQLATGDNGNPNRVWHVGYSLLMSRNILYSIMFFIGSMFF